MRLHPTFYVCRLKPYVRPESSSHDDSPTTTRRASSASPQAASPSPGEGELVQTPEHGCSRWSERLRTCRLSASAAVVSTQRSQEPSQDPPRRGGAPEDRGQPGVDHMMKVMLLSAVRPTARWIGLLTIPVRRRTEIRFVYVFVGANRVSFEIRGFPETS
ncbi:hypothetical protein PHMEG_00028122 [Phytophthora megakarya]|uniref:Uncharacterized protein n=1 Tax=Phytophthora megakarya TaxID=4795 RepID=A0A225V598_9STRA|nr:hypothetical protein PHMEG_00028122 [Phytophthora megakarya]